MIHRYVLDPIIKSVKSFALFSWKLFRNAKTQLLRRNIIETRLILTKSMQ